jgi:hypothetical protein
MSDRLRDLAARIETLEAELGHLKRLAPSAPADAAAPPPANEDTAKEPSASRRDLLRYGAVALGAAAAAGIAPPAEAADGGAVIIGASNTATNSTYLTTSLGSYCFYAENTSGGYGLVGRAVATSGMFGDTSALDNFYAGVYGASNAGTGQAPGVFGRASSPNAPAVYGINGAGGNAMRAEVPTFGTSNAIALYALNYSTYTGGGPGAGGFAIYGLSAKGHGLVGATAAAGAAAVVGATNGVADAYAATFFGPVVVGGDFTVVGGAKSAAVLHPDGSHRRLYCVESPESWFEDFGEAALVCGETSIALDPDFASVVDASKYHVFLTGYDGRSDLSVSDRSPDGFRVRGSEGAEGTFSWRVVARRKDIAGARLERVEIPKEPALPDVPDSVHEPMPSPPDLSRMGVPPHRPNRKT